MIAPTNWVHCHRRGQEVRGDNCVSELGCKGLEVVERLGEIELFGCYQVAVLVVFWCVATEEGR